MNIIRNIPDLNFTIVADVFSHYVEFKIYEIVYWLQTDEHNLLAPFDKPVWSKIDSADTSNLDDAAVYLSGSVKWDGCSNWKFDEQDRCMLHGCSRDDLLNLGKIMATCWDMAEELCPNWYR